jgi:hypothetical protein
MFLSKDTTCCENASNVFCVLPRNVRCDREMRLQISFLQKYLCEFVLVIMLDHLTVCVSTAWPEVFRDDDCLTRATHQTRRKRLIKLDRIDIPSCLISESSLNLTSNISSNLMNRLSFSLTNDISSNLMSWSSFSLTGDISSNLMISHQTWWRLCLSLSDERSWMTSEVNRT